MIALFVLAGALLWQAQEARASAHSHVPEGASGPSCGRVFLAASDAAAFGRFGQSVAIEDDTLMVGAPAQPPPAGAGSGHVYTFVREGGLWQERDKVRAQGLAALFGTSVDLSG